MICTSNASHVTREKGIEYSLRRTLHAALVNDVTTSDVSNYKKIALESNHNTLSKVTIGMNTSNTSNSLDFRNQKIAVVNLSEPTIRNRWWFHASRVWRFVDSQSII